MLGRASQDEKGAIIQILPKLDGQAEPNLANFVASMEQGNFPYQNWIATIRIIFTVKAASIYQEMSVTVEMLYQTFTTLLLERLQYTASRIRHAI